MVDLGQKKVNTRLPFFMRQILGVATKGSRFGLHYTCLTTLIQSKTISCNKTIQLNGSDQRKPF
jgi:hypothetical protein